MIPKSSVLLLLISIWITFKNARTSELRVVCYYTNWSVYRPGTAKFTPQNINPYLCTHLIYAFGGFTKENNLKPFDKYQDIEKGGYAKFTGLKTYNKKLKTMIAIGGWNEGSSRFSPLVASPERRKELIKNVVKFLRINHFDGLDLDWEYPSFRDGGKPRDRDNYAQFVQELREEFNRESQKTGRPRLLLTMAVPAGIEYIDKGYDVPKLNEYLDWFNILSYDYHSAFEPSVNHHAPLYPLEEDDEYNFDGDLNIDHTVKHYIEAGADSDKLVLGIPTYGRSYTLFNPDATELGAPADGPGEMGDATRENGYLAYYEICENIKEGRGWTVIQPNPRAMGPYAYRENQWVGYDDEEAVRRKAEYAVIHSLGGIMFWAIDNDDFRGNCHNRPYPLIEAAKEALLQAARNTDNIISTASKSSKSHTRVRGKNFRNNTTSTYNKNVARTNSGGPQSSGESKYIDSNRQRIRNRVRPQNQLDNTDEEPIQKPNLRKRVNNRQQINENRNNESRNRISNTKRRQILRKTTTTTTTTTTTPPPPTLTTPGYNTPEPPTTPDPGSDFRCEDEGFFPHPRDCKKYFWCLSSGPSDLGIVAHQFTCPSGLYFNKAADSCDYARNVLCNKKKATTTTKAPSTSISTTTSTTTTKAPTTRRPPPKITAATSRTTFKFSKTTSTTPEPNYEDEYVEYYDDEFDSPNDSRDLEDLPDSEEDPRVIKELIDLIRKAGGIEELEKQLNIQNDGSTTVNGASTTPTTISKTLYERVLSGRNNGRKFGTLGTTEKTLGESTVKYVKYSSLNRNSNSGPQNEGIERSQEEGTNRRGKPQYTTITRQRQSFPDPKSFTNDEEEDEFENDFKSRPEQELSDSVASVTQRDSTFNRPEYVTIRRTRPTTPTEEATQPVVDIRSSFSQNRAASLFKDTENNDEDSERIRTTQNPEYVTIRRVRPITESSATSKYQSIQRNRPTTVSSEYETNPVSTSNVDLQQSTEQPITYSQTLKLQYTVIDPTTTTLHSSSSVPNSDYRTFPVTPDSERTTTIDSINTLSYLNVALQAPIIEQALKTQTDTTTNTDTYSTLADDLLKPLLSIADVTDATTVDNIITTQAVFKTTIQDLQSNTNSIGVSSSHTNAKLDNITVAHENTNSTFTELDNQDTTSSVKELNERPTPILSQPRPFSFNKRTRPTTTESVEEARTTIATQKVSLKSSSDIYTAKNRRPPFGEVKQDVADLGNVINSTTRSNSEADVTSDNDEIQEKKNGTKVRINNRPSFTGRRRGGSRFSTSNIGNQIPAEILFVAVNKERPAQVNDSVENDTTERTLRRNRPSFSSIQSKSTEAGRKTIKRLRLNSTKIQNGVQNDTLTRIRKPGGFFVTKGIKPNINSELAEDLETKSSGDSALNDNESNQTVENTQRRYTTERPLRRFRPTFTPAIEDEEFNLERENRNQIDRKFRPTPIFEDLSSLTSVDMHLKNDRNGNNRSRKRVFVRRRPVTEPENENNSNVRSDENTQKSTENQQTAFKTSSLANPRLRIASSNFVTSNPSTTTSSPIIEDNYNEADEIHEQSVSPNKGYRLIPKGRRIFASSIAPQEATTESLSAENEENNKLNENTEEGNLNINSDTEKIRSSSVSAFENTDEVSVRPRLFTRRRKLISKTIESEEKPALTNQSLENDTNTVTIKRLLPSSKNLYNSNPNRLRAARKLNITSDNQTESNDNILNSNTNIAQKTVNRTRNIYSVKGRRISKIGLTTESDKTQLLSDSDTLTKESNKSILEENIKNTYADDDDDEQVKLSETNIEEVEFDGENGKENEDEYVITTASSTITATSSTAITTSTTTESVNPRRRKIIRKKIRPVSADNVDDVFTESNIDNTDTVNTTLTEEPSGGTEAGKIKRTRKIIRRLKPINTNLDINLQNETTSETEIPLQLNTVEAYTTDGNTGVQQSNATLESSNDIFYAENTTYTNININDTYKLSDEFSTFATNTSSEDVDEDVTIDIQTNTPSIENEIVTTLQSITETIAPTRPTTKSPFLTQKRPAYKPRRPSRFQTSSTTQPTPSKEHTYRRRVFSTTPLSTKITESDDKLTQRSSFKPRRTNFQTSTTQLLPEEENKNEEIATEETVLSKLPSHDNTTNSQITQDDETSTNEDVSEGIYYSSTTEVKLLTENVNVIENHDNELPHVTENSLYDENTSTESISVTNENDFINFTELDKNIQTTTSETTKSSEISSDVYVSSTLESSSTSDSSLENQDNENSDYNEPNEYYFGERMRTTTIKNDDKYEIDTQENLQLTSELSVFEIKDEHHKTSEKEDKNDKTTDTSELSLEQENETEQIIPPNEVEISKDSNTEKDILETSSFEDASLFNKNIRTRTEKPKPLLAYNRFNVRNRGNSRASDQYNRETENNPNESNLYDESNIEKTRGNINRTSTRISSLNRVANRPTYTPRRPAVFNGGSRNNIRNYPRKFNQSQQVTLNRSVDKDISVQTENVEKTNEKDSTKLRKMNTPIGYSSSSSSSNPVSEEEINITTEENDIKTTYSVDDIHEANSVHDKTTEYISPTTQYIATKSSEDVKVSTESLYEYSTPTRKTPSTQYISTKSSEDVYVSTESLYENTTPIRKAPPTQYTSTKSSEDIKVSTESLHENNTPTRKLPSAQRTFTKSFGERRPPPNAFIRNTTPIRKIPLVQYGFTKSFIKPRVTTEAYIKNTTPKQFDDTTTHKEAEIKESIEVDTETTTTYPIYSKNEEIISTTPLPYLLQHNNDTENEITKNKLEKLVEVNRIVEVSFKEDKITKNSPVQTRFMLGSVPKLDKIGEVNRLTVIKVIDGNINNLYTIVGKTNNNDATSLLEALVNTNQNINKASGTVNPSFKNENLQKSNTPIHASREEVNENSNVQYENKKESTSQPEVILSTFTTDSNTPAFEIYSKSNIKNYGTPRVAYDIFGAPQFESKSVTQKINDEFIFNDKPVVSIESYSRVANSAPGKPEVLNTETSTISLQALFSNKSVSANLHSTESSTNRIENLPTLRNLLNQAEGLQEPPTQSHLVNVRILQQDNEAAGSHSTLIPVDAATIPVKILSQDETNIQKTPKQIVFETTEKMENESQFIKIGGSRTTLSSQSIKPVNQIKTYNPDEDIF